MSAAGVHAQLMREMRTPPGDGFDPIPPSQHAFFMDIDQPAENRAWGWMSAKTYAGKGHKRSAFARDERGPLTLKHAAADLGWELSNTSVVFGKLEAQGRIFRDDKGRIYLHGNVQKPRLTREGEEKENERYNPLSTYNLPDDFLFYYQSLDSERRAQCERDVIRLGEWDKQADAELWAELRRRKAAVWERCFEAYGFRREKPKGRPRLERENRVVVQLDLALPELSVHISKNDSGELYAQNGNAFPHETENGSAHIGASLLGFSESSESLRVSAAGASSDFAQPDSLPNPPTTPLTPEPEPPEAENPKPENLPAEEKAAHTSDTVVAAFEEALGRKLAPKDPLRARLGAMPARLNIPAAAIVAWLGAKHVEKRARRYPIHSAGALFSWLERDLAGWLEQYAIQRPRAGPPAPPEGDRAPFDEDAFRAQLDKLIEKKGMP